MLSRSSVACLGLILAWIASVGFGIAYAAETSKAKPIVDPALKALQDFVGQWKGVGQVKRGSTQGGWIEASDWRWDFQDGKSALVFDAPNAKYLKTGKITSQPPAKAAASDIVYTLTAGLPDGKNAEYVGGLQADGSLVFSSDAVPEPAPTRITLRFAAEKKRLVATLERRAGADAFNRLGEIGYTRQGSGFGEGKFEPECIVTGGIGTMPFTYNGKTYYVCCTGCKDLFNSDPETYVAEYEAKLKKELKK